MAEVGQTGLWLGRGWGWGSCMRGAGGASWPHPPPHPSPKRGEGADRVCCTSAPFALAVLSPASAINNSLKPMCGGARDRWMAGIAALVATAVLLAGAAQAVAQTEAAAQYPSRAVKIIVSAPPGGGLDIAARVIADRLAKIFGQPFVVENRPGAGGNLGAEAVAQAEPAGYTFLAAPPAPLTTHARLYKRLNFDPPAL